MDSSTPTINRGYRNTVLIPDDESPIVSNYRSNIQGISSANDGGETITDRSSARLARSPTRLSDAMDKNKLTPTKPISESVDDRNLAGGAADLSRAAKALRRANSLPNLSRDIKENCLFHQFPTWNEIHKNRSRSKSMCNVDYSNWSNGDFPNGSDGKNQQIGATSGEGCVIGNLKRILSVSLSTPIGLPRKHLFQECSPELKEITFGEDVEMLDLEQVNQSKQETMAKPTSILDNIGNNIVPVSGRNKL